MDSTFAIGGSVPVRRIGFGALRLTGPGGWGPPADPDQAAKVLRRAVDLGVELIDTADAYGPGSNEELIADVLHPYPARLVVATKAGQCRPGPGLWQPLGRPEYLRQQAELSLRRLRLEAITLFQLHRIDPLVPVAEQFGALAQLQQEGKIVHIGLSEVSLDELKTAREQIAVASVQNRYNLTDRRHEGVLDYCTEAGIAFLPWHPVGKGSLTAPGGPVAEIATQLAATPAQVALAWLLRRSPAIVLIPGTSSVTHLEENLAASDLTLPDDAVELLDRVPGDQD